ncbi:MAG: thiamine ABC transporter substrate binding subunit [Devosiaceae bacterium]|nr:thiamine ABC transporter substrate binding subunit [Devosiaceae bacterium MH13]
MTLSFSEFQRPAARRVLTAFAAGSALLAAPVIAPMAALADDRELTIYTYDSFVADWGPGPLLTEQFEAQCGCTINWVAPGDGVAVLNRLRFEGDQTDADLVLGLDTNLIAEARDTGLIAAHETDLSALELPLAWDDEAFVPFDFGYFAIVYDTQAITSPPTSLDALIAMDDTHPLVIQDPRTSTPGLGFLLWMKAVYGDEAAQKWADLNDSVLTVTPGWSEAYGLFTSGEAPMVLSYTTSPAYHMVVESDERYQALAFDEGHYMQIEVAAAIEGSPELDLARDFLAFLISPQAQSVLPVTNWMLPVAAGAEPLPEPFERLVEPSEALLLEPEMVAEQRATWVEEWLDAVSR